MEVSKSSRVASACLSWQPGHLFGATSTLRRSCAGFGLQPSSFSVQMNLSHLNKNREEK